MKWFNNPKTLEELKKQYKSLALNHHPDRGGILEDMQAINNEYDELFKVLKNVHANAQGETYTSSKETEETADQFKDIINTIIHFQNVQIEIIGCWLWITGNTKPYKDILKKIKFRWSNQKMAWYYHAEPFKKKSKNNLSLEQIRELFTSQTIQTQRQEQLA